MGQQLGTWRSIMLRGHLCGLKSCHLGPSFSEERAWSRTVLPWICGLHRSQVSYKRELRFPCLSMVRQRPMGPSGSGPWTRSASQAGVPKALHHIYQRPSAHGALSLCPGCHTPSWGVGPTEGEPLFHRGPGFPGHQTTPSQKGVAFRPHGPHSLSGCL